MACVHQIDFLGIQEVIILQIRCNKGIAAVGNSLGNIAAAGAAAYRYAGQQRIRLCNWAVTLIVVQSLNHF